jgi:hypothetical protein
VQSYALRSHETLAVNCGISLLTAHKLRNINTLQKYVIVIMAFLILASQVLSPDVKKEAATSSMSLTLFDSPRPFPNNRSGWRNGILH